MSDWDKFVAESPQGTVFSTTKWCDIFDKEYKIYTYEKGGEIFGGIIGFMEDGVFKSGATPLTPFQGVLIKPTDGMKEAKRISLYNEVTENLIAQIKNDFVYSTIFNHYTMDDIRPFIWNGYDKQFVRYTYVVDLADKDKLWKNLEKQTRYEIGHLRNWQLTIHKGPSSIFGELYGETFKRKGFPQPVSDETVWRLCDSFDATVALLQLYPHYLAGVVIVGDARRTYYILGASDGTGASSTCLWNTLEHIDGKELDMVGANDKNIALFKRGFGGKLKAYYGVSNV